MDQIQKNVFLALVLVLLIGPAEVRAQNRPGLSLKETFDLYVCSVQNADLEGLFSTVTKDHAFAFITASGELIATREGYFKFHEDWFKQKDWEMPVDSVNIHENGDFGYVTAVFHYKQKTWGGGLAFLDSWFTLVFHKEDGMWKVVADVCTPIRRSSSEAGEEQSYTTEQQFLFRTLLGRRTVRGFKPDPVPREHILKILNAARHSPTAGNQQPWTFLVVQDRSRLDSLKGEVLRWIMEEYQKRRQPEQKNVDQMRDTLRARLEDILSAPVYVAVLVDSGSRYPDYNLQDGSLAAGTLMIAARSLGYGTGFFTSFFPERQMKEFFKIPDRYKLICFSPLGVPVEWPQTPPKKPLEELVHFERFEIP